MLKTHVYNNNFTQNHPTEQEQPAENFPFAAPATGSISHAPAQLRLATHERIEIEIDFPVTGGRINRTRPPKGYFAKFGFLWAANQPKYPSSHRLG